MRLVLKQQPENGGRNAGAIIHARYVLTAHAVSISVDCLSDVVHHLRTAASVRAICKKQLAQESPLHILVLKQDVGTKACQDIELAGCLLKVVSCDLFAVEEVGHHVAGAGS